jgi:hypothetical protein
MEPFQRMLSLVTLNRCYVVFRISMTMVQCIVTLKVRRSFFFFKLILSVLLNAVSSSNWLVK